MLVDDGLQLLWASLRVLFDGVVYIANNGRRLHRHCLIQAGNNGRAESGIGVESGIGGLFGAGAAG